MLYVQVIARLNGVPVEARVVAQEAVNRVDYDYQNRNDWKTFEQAEQIAKALGAGYIATDAGDHVSPRYDVIELPKIGDEVSYAFNGDYYPCGKIEKISKKPEYRRIATTDGTVFYRRGNTGTWKHNQTWSLVAGHINKRNPEF